MGQLQPSSSSQQTFDLNRKIFRQKSFFLHISPKEMTKVSPIFFLGQIFFLSETSSGQKSSEEKN